MLKPVDATSCCKVCAHLPDASGSEKGGGVGYIVNKRKAPIHEVTPRTSEPHREDWHWRMRSHRSAHYKCPLSVSGRLSKPCMGERVTAVEGHLLLAESKPLPIHFASIRMRSTLAYKVAAIFGFLLNIDCTLYAYFCIVCVSVNCETRAL